MQHQVSVSRLTCCVLLSYLIRISVVDLEPGLQVECDSCGVNITHSVHIRCAAEECRVTNIDLCPGCFCKGKEMGKHKASHPYRVIVSSLCYSVIGQIFTTVVL